MLQDPKQLNLITEVLRNYLEFKLSRFLIYIYFKSKFFSVILNKPIECIFNRTKPHRLNDTRNTIPYYTIKPGLTDVPIKSYMHVKNNSFHF